MAFDASQFMYSSGSSSYEINNSVRLDSAASAKLTNTFANAGNRRTFTFSTWVKRSTVAGYTVLFGIEEASDGTAENLLFFDTTSGNIRFGWNDFTRSSAQFCRDVNGWYHILLAVDTTQGTAANRIKMYVNGVQVLTYAASSNDDPDENEQFLINKASEHHIGVFPRVGAYANVYMAETHFIDGAAKAPADFGETGDYGEFKPIAYAGSYGDEGFYLDYKSSGVGTASSSTIGADRSGNTNHWSSTNIATTDQMLDSPTNNFPRFNFLRGFTPTLFKGNLLTETSTNTVSRSVDTNFEPPSGKWYVEVLVKVAGGGETTHVGVANSTFITGNEFKGHSNGVSYCQNGQKGLNNASLSDYGATYTDGDVIGIAYDTDNDNITFLKNNAAQPQLTSGFDISNGRVVVATNSSSATGQRYGINFGQDSSFAGEKTAGGNSDANGIGDFLYAVPSGYLALCNSNLPEPSIVPTAYFNTVLYTGDGSAQDITSVGFSPNLTWIKNRATTDANQIFDSVRGVTKTLDSGSTVAETVNDDTLTHFLSNGFTTGDDVTTNTDGEGYVAWNWKAGTSVSGNSTGSGADVAYTGSVNTDAGFSIIKYGGNNTAGHQIPHHLGVVPDMIWIKNLTTQSWNCFFPNTSLGATKGLQLDNGGAQGTVSHLNNTMPSTSVVTLSTGAGTNTKDGNDDPQPYVMYSFKSIPGYSKMNMYKGNGSADGSFVFCGFRPAFVLMKVTGLDDERWMMYDSKRDPVNFVSTRLLADDNNAESSGSGQSLDFLSNGFKIRANQASINSNGYFYVYMAFAEMPEKYSNAR